MIRAYSSHLEDKSVNKIFRHFSCFCISRLYYSLYVAVKRCLYSSFTTFGNGLYSGRSRTIMGIVVCNLEQFLQQCSRIRKYSPTVHQCHQDLVGIDRAYGVCLGCPLRSQLFDIKLQQRTRLHQARSAHKQSNLGCYKVLGIELAYKLVNQ